MPDRITMLALAALYDLADSAKRGPLPPTLYLRALLGLLHARSDGTIEPYRKFWRDVTWPGIGEAADGYQRATYARTAMYGIGRSLGLELMQPDLQAMIYRFQHDRSTKIVVELVKDAVYEREILATKGSPKSQRGREIMARNLAAGLDPDGTPRR